jgi:hypothetical protein
VRIFHVLADAGAAQLVCALGWVPEANKDRHANQRGAA